MEPTTITEENMANFPHTSNHSKPDVESLLDIVTPDRFTEWYHKREYRKNIREGTPYFNGASSIPEPRRHSPSQLLQCHRKRVYRAENAPAEEADPKGIFWFGTRYEEDILLPFLEEIVADVDAYVQNSIWVDFCSTVDGCEIQLKGATDPVVVDAEAAPILPTEVKTKESVENITEPNRHHRAQVHAYLVGLSRKYERDLTDAVIIYGARKSLNLKSFHIEFDPDFWENTVLSWATKNTQFRLKEELPPSEPEYDWECKFCSYRARCGKANLSYSDLGSEGFVPEFQGYPRRKVIEYCEDNPDERLTPSLAHQYPDLAERFGVIDWYCCKCDADINWQKIDPEGNPLCPRCAEQGNLSTLSLPAAPQ